MNYRHSYHAGNFADVVKHAVLVLLLQALRRKDTPFCYLETHAGVGRYDLAGAAARKTGEWRAGIGRLWGGATPAGLADYLALVRGMNPGAGAAPRWYPGSPRIARHFLRAGDRMLLLELQPEEAYALAADFAGDTQVKVAEQDGYAGLKAYLPPMEKRGLVLIDPPYEQADEFKRVVDALKTGYGRFATGVFAIWYPIKDRPALARFHRRLVASGIRRILCAELYLYPDEAPVALNGCGLIIVNPPWQLDDQLRALLPQLLDRLQVDARGRTRVEWLVPE